jgi:hypothetical protein
MKDPFKKKRNELAIRQTQLFEKHCGKCIGRKKPITECEGCKAVTEFEKLRFEMFEATRPRIKIKTDVHLSMEANREIKQKQDLVDTRIAEFKRLKEKGLKLTQIATYLGMPYSKLREFGIRHELIKTNRKTNKQLKDLVTPEEIQSLKAEGKTDSEIGKLYGFSKSTVFIFRKEYGIGYEKRERW